MVLQGCWDVGPGTGASGFVPLGSHLVAGVLVTVLSFQCVRTAQYFVQYLDTMEQR